MKNNGGPNERTVLSRVPQQIIFCFLVSYMSHRLQIELEACVHSRWTGFIQQTGTLVDPAERGAVLFGELWRGLLLVLEVFGVKLKGEKIHLFTESKQAN